MKTRFFALLVLILALFSTFAASCGSGAGRRNIFAYAEGDASFTLTFVSESGEVSCDCTRVGERVTLCVTSPERSRGIAVTVDESGCTIRVGGETIPISEDAARGLTNVLDLMLRGSEGAEVRMSADGEYTEIVYEDGVLTLDGEGVPVAASVGRAVKISNYVTKE
ncbi:MAG: hypothetical protein IJC62_01155 [Clostridia bacterium]|nr:hypothetical protein [Clostridia bacterium]